jgi:hypothetical protein
MRMLKDGSIYVHPIRTAGTSIEAYIDHSRSYKKLTLPLFKTPISAAYRHASLAYCKKKQLYSDSKTKVISVIRNPEDWVFSVWKKVRSTFGSGAITPHEYAVLNLQDYCGFIECLTTLDPPPPTKR